MPNWNWINGFFDPEVLYLTQSFHGFLKRFIFLTETKAKHFIIHRILIEGGNRDGGHTVCTGKADGHIPLRLFTEMFVTAQDEITAVGSEHVEPGVFHQLQKIVSFVLNKTA